jgi:hypothetical protein
MMTGYNGIKMPGTVDTNSDAALFWKNMTGSGPSFDQFLIDKSVRLQKTPVRSLQLTAHGDSTAGFPVFRVMSYAGAQKPLFPEVRPEKVYDQVFGGVLGDPARLEAERVRKRSVLDFVKSDIKRMSARIPKWQKPKLDTHLEAIVDLETKLRSGAAIDPRTCRGPALPTIPMTPAWQRHAAVGKAQFQIIKTAFLCDLTRVATFTWAHGNSRENGHHGKSHGNYMGHAQVDALYSQMMAEILADFQNTPDGPGSTLLDNTLIVYFSECGEGNYHSFDDVGMILFGGANTRLRGGRFINLGGRSVLDLWSAIAQTFGVGDSFGNPMAAKVMGPVSGLFA